MEPTARIPAASKQEAMDWSLVPVSQGIESKIDTASENQEWWLEVPLHEWDRAIETLRKYRRENKRWLWRRQVTSKGLLFDWAALSWVVLITVFYWASSELPAIMKAGSMDTAAAGGGQWWRLCTAVWLHADIAHLASNAAVGIVLLGLALGLYGTGTGMLAAYLAGIGGNLIAWAAATTPHRSLGASGLVMGCIGLMAAHTLLIRGPNRLKLFITSFVAALMLFVLLGPLSRHGHFLTVSLVGQNVVQSRRVHV